MWKEPKEIFYQTHIGNRGRGKPRFRPTEGDLVKAEHQN